MITLELNIGMASQYFMTDPSKMLAIAKNPYIIISNEQLSIKEFSECFATINNRIYPKKIDALQFEAFVDALVNEKRPSSPSAAISNPLLILTNGIDHKTFVSAKVLKLRGIYLLLIIDMSSISRDELSFRLCDELKNEELHKGSFYTIYKPPKRLSVVSGLTQTIISTEFDSNRIIHDFPNVITKDKTIPQEPIM